MQIQIQKRLGIHKTKLSNKMGNTFSSEKKIEWQHIYKNALTYCKDKIW